MNARQRAVVSGTLKIAGLVLLGFWLGGVVIALAFFRVAQPLVVLAMSLWWGLIGCYAAAMVGGWPTLVLIVVIVIGLYVRAGRVVTAL
jgi:hypothetical protein